MIAKRLSRDDRSAPARAQGNIIFSVFRMFANVRARAPRGTKNGREEKIRSVEQKGPRLSLSHARKVEEREERAGGLASPSRCYAENSRDSR